MNPYVCALLVFVAGALGGVVNALLTDNGFILPRRVQQILCPGFLSNVAVGAFAAFTSWAMYGSGAGVDLAKQAGAGDTPAPESTSRSRLAPGIHESRSASRSQRSLAHSWWALPALAGSRTKPTNVS
jgi:hypothetical protein